MNRIKKYYRYFAYLLVGIALGVNILTLKDGHNWGGDFSQYILHAQNILSGKAYASGIMLELPVVYPPGYPLLIAPVIKSVGVHFPLLKLLNVFFWFASIGFIFPLLCRRMSGIHSTLSALILCFSSFFFVFKQNVISDVAFIFFVNASLYFFVRFLESFEKKQGSRLARQWHLLFFVICACGALWIRSAGAVLFLAAGFYLILIRRNLKSLGIIALSFLFAVGSQVLITGIHQGFWAHISEAPGAFLVKSIKNFSLSYRSLVWFFIHPQTPVTLWIFNALDRSMSVLAFVFTLMIFYYFGKGIWKKTLTFIGCFSFFYFLLLVFWSGFPHHPANFCRYLLPLVAPSLVYMVEKIDKPISIIHIRKKEKFTLIVNGFLIFLLVINVYNLVNSFSFDDDVLFQEENQQMFAWVKKNIAEDEHYMIWQARPVCLMTGRVGAVPWRYQQQRDVKLSSRMKALNVSYLIALKGYDDQLMQMLDAQAKELTSVWENKGYKVYKVLSNN